jgi:hypothetical protein
MPPSSLLLVASAPPPLGRSFLVFSLRGCVLFVLRFQFRDTLSLGGYQVLPASRGHGASEVHCDGANVVSKSLASSAAKQHQNKLMNFYKHTYLRRPSNQPAFLAQTADGPAHTARQPRLTGRVTQNMLSRCCRSKPPKAQSTTQSSISHSTLSLRKSGRCLLCPLLLHIPSFLSA